jgi:hypothetical protein
VDFIDLSPLAPRTIVNIEIDWFNPMALGGCGWSTMSGRWRSLNAAARDPP